MLSKFNINVHRLGSVWLADVSSATQQDASWNLQTCRQCTQNQSLDMPDTIAKALKAITAGMLQSDYLAQLHYECNL